MTSPQQLRAQAAEHLAARRFAEVGLLGSGFFFACFNNHRKIGPGPFDIWMRLLAAVPGSVLWLLDDSANEAMPPCAASIRRV
jgi:protein O-GlcNAc transferase